MICFTATDLHMFVTLFNVMPRKDMCKFQRRRFAEAVGCYLRRYKKQRRILEEAYRVLLGAGGGGGNVLLTEHAIRAMGGSQKRKATQHEKGGKKNSPLQQ